MPTITFNVTNCPETGGFISRWDDLAGGGITTQGDSMAELESNLRDAVSGYFFDRSMPTHIKLHFIEDPELAVV